MAFDEDRLPADVERGARGSAGGFNTTVVEIASGFEKRNINWPVPKGEWNVGYGIQGEDRLSPVIDFFWARQGRARGFRFKDWSDYKITQNTNGNLGTGDGVQTVFQARKQYVSGSVTNNREIKKLVSGTVTVFFDDVAQVSGFTIDNNTGQITFAPAVPNGVVVSITAEFDVPVRFDIDRLEISMETFEAGAVLNIPIKEIRIQ